MPGPVDDPRAQAARVGGVCLLYLPSSFAKVPDMADEQSERGEITERFRAFAEASDPPPGKGLPIGLLVGAVVLVALLVVAVIALIS
jgi:hypothetical protein